MEDMNITFEDLPKAMSWMMDKLNKLDSKIDSLNNIPQVRPVDQWMNLKELCEYLPSHPAEQTFTDGRVATRFRFIREGSVSCFSNRRLTHGFMTASGNHRRNWRKKLYNSLMPNETDRSNGFT